MNLACKPSQVAKVHDFWRTLDDQDPLYWALHDMLSAYYDLERGERKIQQLFGKDAFYNLVKR